jgi:hypothetical protein
MPRLLPMVVLALLLGGCGYGTDTYSCSGCSLVAGSGVLKVVERTVPKFTAIEQDNVGVILITQGEAETLAIESDDNVLPVLMSEVRDGVLHLSVERGKGCTAHKLIYRITVRSLERLDLSGSASADIKNITGKRLGIGLAGSGSLTATGKITELSLIISGTSNVDARELFVERANVTLAGTGSATLAVNKELDATLTGTGSLRYSGGARVNSNITGTGAIKKI